MGSQMISSAMRLYSLEILLRNTMVSICKTQTSISYNQQVCRDWTGLNLIPDVLDPKGFVIGKQGWRKF